MIKKWMQKGPEPHCTMIITADNGFWDVMKDLQGDNHEVMIAFGNYSTCNTSQRIRKYGKFWDWEKFLPPLSHAQKIAAQKITAKKNIAEAKKMKAMEERFL